MKRFLFIFALVVSLLLPCAQNVYADTSYDDSKDYLAMVEGYSQEQVYEYLLSIASSWRDLNNYPYVCFFDYKEFNEVNDLYNPSYILFLSNKSAYWHPYDYLAIPSSSIAMVFAIYSDGTLMRNISDVLYSDYQMYANCDFLAYSNYEVYDDDEILRLSLKSFPVPQVVLGMEKAVLAQVITQQNPLKEILTILPMVIPCLVGYAALRKALRLLATILRTA